jgi:TnpA family transposase
VPVRIAAGRSSEFQEHSLNLLVAAIIPWNTVYLQRAVDHLLTIELT